MNYSQEFRSWVSSLNRQNIVDILVNEEDIEMIQPIPSSSVIYQCKVKENDSETKQEQVRIINIIGTFVSGLFPTKSFVVTLAATLDGVKYKITFNRGGLTQNQQAMLNQNLHTISFRISKQFSNVYHLEPC
jgi:hypothetical protein